MLLTADDDEEQLMADLDLSLPPEDGTEGEQEGLQASLDDQGQVDEVRQTCCPGPFM